MTFKKSETGAAHLALIIVVILVVVIGFVGYRVVKNNNKSLSNTPVAVNNNAPTQIKTQADVKQAAKALDATSIDSSLDPSQLDKDLNSLL